MHRIRVPRKSYGVAGVEMRGARQAHRQGLAPGAAGNDRIGAQILDAFDNGFQSIAVGFPSNVEIDWLTEGAS